MSKTSLLNFTLVVASSLLFYSCFSNDELSSIPKDARCIFSVRPLDLWRKTGNDFASSNLVKKILAKTKEENRGLAKFYKQLMENPTATGINWLKPTYFFIVEEGKDRSYFVILTPLQDATDFAKTFEEFTSKRGRRARHPQVCYSPDG